MSLFIVPTIDAPRRRPMTHSGSSCGAMAIQSPFDLVFGGGAQRASYADVEEDRFAAYEAHLRQQQQIEERRVQERYAALRRQAELERERERRRIQAQQLQQQQQRRRQAALAAAHAAWQQQQQYEAQERARAFAVLEQKRRQQAEAVVAERERQRQRYLHHQQQVEAHRRRHQHQRRHSPDEQVAAAIAQEQWEQLAAEGLATAFNFAKQFFALDKDDMEVDSDQAKPQEKATRPDDADPEEQVPTSPLVKEPAVPEQQPVQTDSKEAPAESAKATAPEQQRLVFTHPLPADANDRATLTADNIQVTYDQPSRTIQIRGLWSNDDLHKHDADDNTTTTTTVASSSASSSSDDDETRGRTRSRSPKRSRVADVDEVTGEEIDADGFVAVSKADQHGADKGKQRQGTARLAVPENADVANLRAELTDEGFQVWL